MYHLDSGREVYFWLAVVLIVYFAVVPSVAAKVSMTVLLVCVIAFGVVPKVMTALGYDLEEETTKAHIRLYRFILFIAISFSLAFVIVFTR